jgi:hypothetical protein
MGATVGFLVHWCLTRSQQRFGVAVSAGVVAPMRVEVDGSRDTQHTSGRAVAVISVIAARVGAGDHG